MLRSDSFWTEHLLRRAGFGASPDELEYYKKLGYEGAVEQLLHPESVSDAALEEQVKEQGFDFLNPADLKRWWLLRMATTKRPLQEKMTLFWHGHFATSVKKVNNPYAMYLQNQLFRSYALGNFPELLGAVSCDPAMIVWLDNQQNRKGKPNENYAREVMELFTMGIGNYSEDDVKEAARAFTGWQTRPQGFAFNQNQHDFGKKTVLGVTGDLNGTDIISILSQKPATAEHLSKKLVAYFAFENPDQGFLDEIADVYMQARGNVAPMLKTIFLHPSFMSDRAYHAKIKSPAELVVGTIKTLQVQNLDADLPSMMARLGQILFAPPNVKGWDGGPAWISTDTMMERFNFAARISGQKFDAIEGYFSPSQLVYSQGLKSAGAMVDYFLALLVDKDVPPSTRERLVTYVSSDEKGKVANAVADDTALDIKLRGLVHLIMCLPTYQLA